MKQAIIHERILKESTISSVFEYLYNLMEIIDFNRLIINFLFVNISYK